MRELARRTLSRVDGCAVPSVQGAFYLLLRIATDLPALEVATRLIREHGVAVIPGNAFGLTHGCYLRVAYGALPKAATMEGLDRLDRGLRTLLQT